MNKFIYVFSTESRDKLLSAGYKLLKSNNEQDMYVFENKEVHTFSLHNISFALSDTLTF